MFLGELPDRVRGPSFRLCTLHPVGTHLDRPLVALDAERMAHHASTELTMRLEDDEVVDALLVQRPCRNDARHAAAKDEDLSVFASVSGREHSLFSWFDGERKDAEKGPCR